MATKRLPRPRDPAQLAKLIVDIATGEVEDRVDDGKDAAAVARGRLGGMKGGAARTEKLPPDQRRKIARRASAARWKKTVEPV
jgi:hypothetical protein